MVKPIETRAERLSRAVAECLNRIELHMAETAIRTCERLGWLSGSEFRALRSEATAAAARIRALKASRARLPEGVHLRTDRPRPGPEPRMFKGGAHVPRRSGP